MTVKELIEKLKEQDLNVQVFSHSDWGHAPVKSMEILKTECEAYGYKIGDILLILSQGV